MCAGLPDTVRLRKARTSVTFSARVRTGIAALTLVSFLTLPVSPVRAVVYGTDVVGDRAVGSDATLRRGAPDLACPAGILETADGTVLWAREADDRRAMASTTKIMTAVVVLEHARLDEVVTVRRSGARVGESGVGLRAGERVSVRDLLEAMLIHSGNDAAAALAEHVSGSAAAFVRLMNEKARQLDLRRTRYTNPHGLDEPGHHTSAEDLAALSRYAMRDAEFRRIVSSVSATMPAPGGGTRRLETSNLLLGEYDGLVGVKTGWTDEAGYCLVSAARRDGVELYGVVLGARSEGSRFRQTVALLDWGFEHYRWRQVTTEGVVVGKVAASDWIDVSVPARVSESTAVPFFDLAGPTGSRVSLPKGVRSPVSLGQTLGTLTVSQGGRLLVQVPLEAGRQVERPTWPQRMWFAMVRAWRVVFHRRARQG